jgi:hypothetical protein
MGELGKLYNEELRDLYSSPSINRIIKSRKIKWAGNVALFGEKRNAYRLLVRKPEGKTKEDQDVGGWIILGWILERWVGVIWTGLVSLREGTGGELL